MGVLYRKRRRGKVLKGGGMLGGREVQGQGRRDKSQKGKKTRAECVHVRAWE